MADVKYKAIILLYASSGMRREALTQLKIKDIEYLPNHKLYKIRIYKNSKSSQICYTTPEAPSAISLYIKNKGLKKEDYFLNVEPKAVSQLLRKIAINAGIASKHSLAAGEEIGRFKDSKP